MRLTTLIDFCELFEPMREFDLFRWETPFTDALFPSVWAVVSPGDIFTLIVSPSDGYPKYIVRFEAEIAYKVLDESCAPVREFVKLRREQKGLSAYTWSNSPWLAEYQESAVSVDVHVGWPLVHYVVLGGDSIVEVLAGEEPVIEDVGEAGALEYTYRL